MGIPGLPTVIEWFGGPNGKKDYPFTRLAGMRIAVDAPLIIYQSVIAPRKNGIDLKNSRGEITSHLNGLFYKNLLFLSIGIKPIYVFDGPAPNIKGKTLQKRREKKEQAIEDAKKSMEEGNYTEYIKNLKKSFVPTKYDYRECKILLDLMGIPYINAPGEGEVMCSWLASRKDIDGKTYVDGVCTDDSDVLAIGAPYMFKGMSRFMSKGREITIISLHKALKEMDLTQEEFIDMCVLLGCDYCDGVAGSGLNVGSVTIFGLISKLRTLENVILYLLKKELGKIKYIKYEDLIKMVKKLGFNLEPDSINNFNSMIDFIIEKSNDNILINTIIQYRKMMNEKIDINCMISARDYYRTAMTDIDKNDNFVLSDDNLYLRQFQYENLMDFMCVKHGFDIGRIEKGISRLDMYYKKMDVIRPNTKHVHDIIHPRSEDYPFIEDIHKVKNNSKERMKWLRKLL